jgi:hypothetical protein
MKINFVLILISLYINFVFLKGPELLSVSVYENSFKKYTFNITLINPNYVKILKNPSKLAYITDIKNKDSYIFNNLTKYYNKIWLFFITDINEIIQVLEKKYESNSILITGLLIPESLDYSQIDFEEHQKYPIFTVDEELNTTLINYDLRKNKKNIYFIINYTENLLIHFFIIFSSFALVSAIVMGVVWNILEKKVGPDFIFSYHERMKYVLCAHIFLSITLIFKTISIMRTENYELTVAVETSLSLSISFFRSLLWFLIYLIACGWNICFQDLDTNEQKKIFRIFVLIAVLFLIDNTLDKYSKRLWVLNISEVKNLLLFLILTFSTVRNINKNLSILKRKYNYALTLLQEYADGISEKIKLLKYLKYDVFCYLPLYLLIVIINKFLLSEYDNPIILLFIYLIPDFILEFLFMILLRPKIVPIFFSIDLGDMFNEVEGNTYICQLPNFDEFNEDNVKEKINYNKNDYNEDEIMPIIVLGPEKNKNNSFIDDNNSDKSGPLDLEINKYFASIKVGLIQKNE